MCDVQFTVFLHIIDLRCFICHVTGAELPQSKTVQIEFEKDTFGAITAHTCSHVISFPTNAFDDSYDIFKQSLHAVIGGELTFNIV